ncbi:MAG TPA: hypothetical protein DCQ06_08760 [Myxococcales bacterium]|nr:hypothetical protein [Myxococcales bacterium]
MQTPAWLSDIELVTFDCFGTLMDWRRGLEQVEIRSEEDFKAFRQVTRKRQEGDRHHLYSQILKESIRELKPDLRAAVVGLFADDFGRMPCFKDAPGSLAALKDLVEVGVLSNCDANHQLDVISTLRVAWDVCVTSQEIRSYKPSDRAWDAIVRMGVARTAATRDSWLHVSAFDKTDLLPARSRGLKTCFLQRPGGDDKATSDLTINSLTELVTLLMNAKAGPVVYEIQTQVPQSHDIEEVASWLTADLMPRMRDVVGLRDTQLVETEPTILVERYTFGGQRDVESYLEAFGAEHRAMVRERFGEIERTTSTYRVKGRA